MTTKTREELVNRALVKLFADGGAGQSPDPEDQATVDGAVDGVLGDLSARDVVEVANDEEIPVEWFEDLAELLKQAVAEDFGRAKDDAKVFRAEVSLRQKNAGGPSFEVQRAEYF